MVLHRVAAVVLPLCCYPLYAADEPTELSQIIVTATRTAQTADETLASVTVITREEIDRRQAISVQEVLRGVPGLGVANSGGLGKATSVFLRGTNSDHVLVLVDGIRYGSATLGNTAFELIPLDQIERIEVVRGPRSSLYGSEAIGGVIQIFTRKGGGPLTPRFSAGGGSHATYKLAGGVSGGGERGWFNFNASRVDTQGFNACRSTPNNPGGCFVFEPDDDGYTNNAGSARAGYRFENGVEIDTRLLHAEGNTEFDGFSVNEADFVQEALSGKLRFAPLSFWEVTLLGGRSLDNSENLREGTDIDRVFDTERQSASLQNDFTVAENHLVTLGFDYYIDLIDSTEDFAVTSRDDKAGFAQYQGTFDGQDVVLGVRYDDNEQFGGNATGNVGWGYTFGPALRLTASWGTAFKAPTFNQLFFPGFGNPNLEPEESENWEAGANGEVGRVSWSLNGYHTEVDQLISIVSDPTATFGVRPANVDVARILGLEARASTTLFGFDLAANLSLIDPENRGEGPDRGKVLPRRAEQMFQFDLDRRFGRFRIGATVYGEGRRFDDAENTRRLDGYVLLDLRAGVELHKNWMLEGRVNNVLDKTYETAAFFNQDDTNLFVTLRYVPDTL